MRKSMKLSVLVVALGFLTACAVTPAEKTADEKARAEQMLNTQVTLAEQCSPEAASLMREMPNSATLNSTERKIFEAKYMNAVNNQVFQACYNMAWKDYREENQVKAAQMAAWTAESDAAFENGFFFNGPFGWEG